MRSAEAGCGSSLQHARRIGRARPVERVGAAHEGEVQVASGRGRMHWGRLGRQDACGEFGEDKVVCVWGRVGGKRKL